jgi:hypothetical protein
VSRAKKKRINAMRRKQRKRAVNAAFRTLRHPLFSSMLMSFLFDRTQAIMAGEGQ